MTAHHHLGACPDCDLLIDITAVPVDFNAVCPRCGHVLYEAHPNAVLRGLALSASGLLLFPLAMLLPIMTLSRMGLVHAGSIADGIFRLFTGGYWVMGTMVLVCAVLAPLIDLLLLFFITSLIWLKKKTPHLTTMMRTLHHIRDWAMLEVLMMGIMVSLVKLKDMATLEFGAGLACMVMTLLCAVLSQVVVNHHELWEKIDALSIDTLASNDNGVMANDNH